MTNPQDVILIFSTAATVEEAREIGVDLVTRRLAACVQIGGPIESCYRWKGQIETAREVPLIIKTTSARYSEVEAAIRAKHSYETPEIVAVPTVSGFEEYLRWVVESVAT